MGIRIRDIELNNFANFFTGLGITHLMIDFSKQTNVVCVIIGKNGRGKTSLLSYMTPFAGIGNIESRDNSKLIIKGEKGYKKITMVDDECHLYEIQHFYQPEGDSHTIKSYFMVDGTELNDNGNVTSFKALVSQYLGIELDYLKLVRVGDNVQNLITSKDTDRKVFMGKILEDVDVYLRQHKKMSKISNEVKAIIGHITDSISKTGITDSKLAAKTIVELDDTITELNDKLNYVNDLKSRAQYEIDLVGFPSDGEITIRELERKVATHRKIREKLDIEDINTQSISGISETIDALEKELVKEQATVDAQQDKLEFVLNEIDASNNKKLALELEIQKEERRLNLTTMREHVVNLQKHINEIYDIRFDEEKPQVTKEEYDEFVLLLKNIRTQLDRVYEFGKSVVSDVVDGIAANQNVSAIIKSSLIQLEATNRADKLALIDKLIDKYVGRTYNCDESEKCTYKMLYDELLSIKDSIPVDTVVKDEAYYYSMKNVNDMLHDILDMISEKKDILKKLPDELQDIFLIDNMFSHMKKLEAIDSNDLDKAVDAYNGFVTDYYIYQDYLTSLEQQKGQLNLLEESSKEAYLRKQYDMEVKSYEDLLERRDDLSSTIDDINDKIAHIKEHIDELSVAREAMEKYESTIDELDTITKQRDKYREAVDKLNSYTTQINALESRLKDTNERHRLLVSSLERYLKLERELLEYTVVQDRYEQLKYALSNRSGLPLFNIELYLQDTVRIANELLDIVYDGSIYLSKFDISETTFRMPFVKNGIEIPDVMNASQGEKSFFNMAISCALRSQSMERYNIALLDEVDSVFDDDNRQKIIPVLDKQLELNNVDQAFLITHNKMFDQYPTDVIDFDNLDASTVPVKWS